MNIKNIFSTNNFAQNALAFYEQLQLHFTPLSTEAVKPADYFDKIEITKTEALALKNIYVIGAIGSAEKSVANFLNKARTADYDYIVLVAVQLSGAQYTRTQLSQLTRKLTRPFNTNTQGNPVAVLFSYGTHICFAHTQRITYKQGYREGEKLSTVTMLKDISIAQPHAAHNRILDALASKTFTTVEETYSHWQKVFSTKELGAAFYKEIFNWYEWAQAEEHNVTYPNNKDITDDDRIIQEHLIRLITRLLFVWFIKQKKLVPQQIFEEDYLQTILLKFDPQGTKQYNYYWAILQNLFFATLNNKIEDRQFAHQKGREHYGIKNLYRYAEEFSIDEADVQHLFAQVPYLNGGLFECLDKDTPDSNGKVFYNDGFSRDNKKHKRAYLPNVLFFEPTKGLINILNKYYFTVEENTPDEIDVALDPELLGKVFENLLGTYNPETKETARKHSGSFYTPRQVVEYMTNTSLVEHLKTKLGAEHEAQFKKLFEPNAIIDNEALKPQIYDALKACTILDPACGSGAYPMGVLNQMIVALEKVLPPKLKTTTWIYDLKLHLIENCIYGIDIQCIAVQISKLRFFISLIAEQQPTSSATDNYGMKELPNLETKFVAANTLIGLKKYKDNTRQGSLFEDPKIGTLKKDIQHVRHEHFAAKNYQTKKQLRDKDSKLRNELLALLNNDNIYELKDAQQLATWNPYDQTTSAPFFDNEWMFGVKDGFDVVIGNPPYGAKLSNEQKNIFKSSYITTNTTKQLKGSLDTYTIFIEKGFNMLTNNGNLHFIVPISITSSKSVSSLHNLLENNCKTIQVSSYSVRPQPVFENAVVNTSILFFTKTNTKNENILSTKMYRKSIDFSLKHLIDNLQFIDVSKTKLIGRYPKISLEIEDLILQKLHSIKNKIRNEIVDDGAPIYYRTTGGRYFKVITNYSTGSTKEKPIYLVHKYYNFIGSILSSNLFFWWYQIYSNNLDLKTYEIEEFPFPVDKINNKLIEKNEKIYTDYLVDIEKKSNVRQTTKYANIDSFKEYKIGKSKHLIDKIDDLIYPLYGLTKDENEFIKNYEIEYRIRDDE